MILDDITGFTKGSEKKVRVQCEDCLQERIVPYKTVLKSIVKYNKTWCKTCANTWMLKNKNPSKNPETIKKILQSKKGYRHSPATIEKMSKARLANPTIMYGDKNPAKRVEVRNKMRIAATGRDNGLRGVPRPEITGDKHPRWNPERKQIKRRLDNQIRNSIPSKQWKEKILARDGNKCVECGSNEHIHVDHIKPLAQLVRENKITSREEAFSCEEIWDVNNGRCLCRRCHRKTKTYGGGSINAGKEKMTQDTHIVRTGTVCDVAKGGFTIKFAEPDIEIFCRVSGKIRENKIQCLLGDHVEVKFSVYDPQNNGIIIRRL